VARQNYKLLLNQAIQASIWNDVFRYENGAMLRLLKLFVFLAAGLLRFRRDLILENLALRQQLTVATERCPRPLLAVSDRVFWALLRRYWSGWKGALVIVQPETVIPCPILKASRIQMTSHFLFRF
jgi:hypothetical protein